MQIFMNSIVYYNYWKWDAAIAPEVCKALLENISWDNAVPGQIGSKSADYGLDVNFRRTDLVWQDILMPLGCITRAHIDIANQAAGWNYILTGQQQTQIGRYRGENEGFYDWHMDADVPVDGIQRKLSCVILLNDPSEFTGGELQLKTKEGENLLTKQGDIIVFPSFLEHKVTPVTQGNRYTAVTWATGPAFR